MYHTYLSNSLMFYVLLNASVCFAAPLKDKGAFIVGFSGRANLLIYGKPSAEQIRNENPLEREGDEIVTAIFDERGADFVRSCTKTWLIQLLENTTFGSIDNSYEDLAVVFPMLSREKYQEWKSFAYSQLETFGED